MQSALDNYETQLRQAYLNLMTKRLGISAVPDEQKMALIGGWLSLLEVNNADYQLSFRDLIDSVEAGEPKGVLEQSGKSWWQEYLSAVNGHTDTDVMRQVNPWVIVRTHHAQRVIEAAEAGDTSLLEEYTQALMNPFDDNLSGSAWANPPKPDEQVSQLSCSS